MTTSIARSVFLAVAITATVGCVQSLSKREKAEYQFFKESGVLVEEKNPKTAAALGLLPGFGSFYTGHWVIGVADLCVWPYSIAWDPVNGYNGAQQINYAATKTAIESKTQQELQVLDVRLEAGAITQASYLEEKQHISDKYAMPTPF
jgi:hypothetical protein